MVTKTVLRQGVTPRPAILRRDSVIPRISAARQAPRLRSVTPELPIQRVEVRFVGAPPTQQVKRASGVTEVEIDGATLRCVVCGSFQPFLEALRGHEVISLKSTIETSKEDKT